LVSVGAVSAVSMGTHSIMYVYTVHIYDEYKLHVEVLKLKKKKAEMVSNLFE